jgi:thioredoxin reductase
MSDDPKQPLLTERNTGPQRRRRAAPRAELTSDVIRFRGLLLATVLGAIVTVVLLVATSGSGSLRAPGPQSRPHREANLDCNACHKPDTQPQKACAGCHGALPSLRPAHQSLRKKGELLCNDCHAIHRADEGVSFLPTGEVIRYGTGWEESVDAKSGFHPTKAVSVPLVPVTACQRCHDLQNSRDPVAACLIPGGTANVCFDEHRDITSLAGKGAKVAPGATTQRDAAWEAAREVAARPRSAIRSRLTGPAGAVGLGLLVALSVYGGARLRARRKAQKLKKQNEPKAELQAATVRRLPVIDTTTCLGCYACVDACPYDVLEVRRYVAVLARADDCCGLTLCEQRCPNGSLVVREGDLIEDRPRVDDRLQALDAPGIYLAGDLTGLPLIRNAINQGAHTAQAVKESLQGLPKRPPNVLDLAIVGAGPAGISAALEAKSLGLVTRVIEQSSVAASIKSFPRGKLVFDQPLGMPLVGDLWLEEATKEELLAKWLRIVRRAELDVAEGQRVLSIDRDAEAFTVVSVDEAGRQSSLRARRVILAVGRRGSPRKLDARIHSDAESQVFYSLADARSFVGQRVVIVGLGDTAMETAIALCRQPNVTVTLLSRSPDFRRGKSRNIDEVRRMHDAGRLELRFENEVIRIDRGRVAIRSPRGESTLTADVVFVMIGSILPWGFLESVGVRRGSITSA